MNLLDKYHYDIQRLCILYNVSQLYAIGSVLTDQFKDSSDIDLIVNFDQNKIDDYAENYYNLKFSLEDILKRPIDLLEGKALKNPYFNKSIEKHKQLVYGWESICLAWHTQGTISWNQRKIIQKGQHMHWISLDNFMILSSADSRTFTAQMEGNAASRTCAVMLAHIKTTFILLQ